MLCVFPIYLPPIRNIQRFKSKIIDRFGLVNHLLDGTELSIQLMKSLYYNSEIVKDGVITIDAASVTASIAISNDGTVNGLVNSNNIDIEFVKILKESRHKRLRYITVAFSMFWPCYYDITETNGFYSMFLFDKIFCQKFLSLCISLSMIISENADVHLGASGTHFLKHFFGKVRRLCKVDCSSPKFEY